MIKIFHKIKTLINIINNSKEGKVVFSNFAYLSLLQFVSYLFPYFTYPYLAVVIGAEGFGKIGFAAAIITWFSTIADWGFNYSATRDLAQNKDNKDKVSEIFSNVLCARVVLVLFSFSLLLLLILFVPKIKSNADVILVTFLMVPGKILFPDWFFQAIEKMKYITVFNISIKVLLTLFVFLFIKEKNDYILQPLFTSLGFLISGIISMYIILVRWKVRLYLVPFKTIYKTIKSSTDIFINNFMPNLYNSFSTFLLGMFYSDSIVGIYDNGKKIMVSLYTLISVISRVFFPFLARRIDKHSMFAKGTMTLAIILSILLFIFAPVLIRFIFNERFDNSIIVLRIVSIAFLFLVIQFVYGTNYLLLTNNDKLFRNITMISSVIGFILAFPLIYYYSYIGASILYTIITIMIGCASMVCALRLKKKSNI